MLLSRVDPGDAMSESRRAAVSQWFDATLHSRLNDKAKGVIVIMQRLHKGARRA